MEHLQYKYQQYNNVLGYVNLASLHLYQEIDFLDTVVIARQGCVPCYIYPPSRLPLHPPMHH